MSTRSQNVSKSIFITIIYTHTLTHDLMLKVRCSLNSGLVSDCPFFNLYRLKVLWNWKKKHGWIWNELNASWKEI